MSIQWDDGRTDVFQDVLRPEVKPQTGDPVEDDGDGPRFPGSVRIDSAGTVGTGEGND